MAYTDDAIAPQLIKEIAIYGYAWPVFRIIKWAVSATNVDTLETQKPTRRALSVPIVQKVFISSAAEYSSAIPTMLITDPITLAENVPKGNHD